MRNNLRRLTLFAIFTAVMLGQAQRNAMAIPIFAQRYHLECKACHTVLPELNAFGNSFRNNGYRLPLPTHGTTIVALRYQLEWEETPAVGNRRFQPGSVLLANQDIGNITAFIHYNFGAAGGPAGLYLGFLANYNAHTQTLTRLGLFELPLAQSPGQRLDDLQQYGYYGTHVGLNDLALAAPRWGLQMQRTVGQTLLNFTVSYGEFKGAPYGGKPVPTGETTSAAAPEVGFFIQTPVDKYLVVGGTALEGHRQIVENSGTNFVDAYQRYGLLAHAFTKRFDLQAEQWWGRDSNSDGFGTVQGSSGGYVRLKYYVTPHSYLAIRYDAAANPIVVRDMVYYAAFFLTPHARFIIQQVQPIAGGKGQLGAAITIGAPWPLHI